MSEARECRVAVRARTLNSDVSDAMAKDAEELLRQWESEYVAAYPERREQARFFAMRTPGPGARSVGS